MEKNLKNKIQMHLTYIEQAVRDVFNSNILNIEANDELEDYLVELKNYLQE